MKRNLFRPEVRQEVVQRLDKLSPDAKGKWGQLSAAQMVRHLTEANRMALGEIPMPDRSNLLGRTIFKWLFLNNIKPPGREKGEIKTLPEVDIIALGIAVGPLETEKDKYKAIVDRLVKTTPLADKHTLFGRMNYNDWGYLAYAHADYHLTQFGI